MIWAMPYLKYLQGMLGFIVFFKEFSNAFCSNILTHCTTIVTGPTRREACADPFAKLIRQKAMVITGLVQTLANRCILDETEEYSGQQEWSSICEQYPEVLTGS